MTVFLTCVFALLFVVSMPAYYILLRWRNECWNFLNTMRRIMPVIFGSMAAAAVLRVCHGLPWYGVIPFSILAAIVVGWVPMGVYRFFDLKIFVESKYHQLAVLLTSLCAMVYVTLLFLFCRGTVFAHTDLDEALYAIAMAAGSLGLILGAVGAPLYTPIYRVFHGTDMGGLPIPGTSIRYSFALSTQKYSQSSSLGTKAEIDIALAKNEWENFQLLLAATEQAETVCVETTDFVNADGEPLKTAIYYTHYSYVPYRAPMNDTHHYPDALIPLEKGKAVTIQKGCNQSFFLEARSAASTAAGDYFATITVKDSGGKVILEKRIKATVWNFTLPVTHYSDTAVGLFGSNFFGFAAGLPDYIYGHNGDGAKKMSPQQEVVYQQYYDYLLDHGISAYILPYDILDDRADDYMSDPRVTSFQIPYYEEDAILTAAYQKVSANPQWAHKAYFYPIDEPHTKEQFDSYHAIVERLERLCPGFNMVTPFYCNHVPAGADCTPLEMERKHNTILCPQQDLNSDAFYYLSYPGFRKNLAAAMKEGKRVWWYVCCGPNDSSGFCNLYIHQPAIKHRMLFWQQYAYAVTGFLYWGAAYWERSGNPWQKAKTYLAWNNAGDGMWLYPGRDVGVNGPVGSLRLKNVAAGLEDYDYLKLAEEAFGKDWVDKTAAKLTTSVSRYTKDCDLMEAVRREIGEKLSAANIP